MDIEAIKARARLLDERTQAEMAKPYFQNVMAWFTYLGLLRHNTIQPRRVRVTLHDALRAGEIEPRVLEVLPALLLKAPAALKHQRSEMPEDLRAVLAAVKQRVVDLPFRTIPAHKYLHWLTSPILESAVVRLHFRNLPRRRGEKSSTFAAIVSQSRIERAMTQRQLAERHGLSLRVIRDLEQGKMTASLQSVVDVLGALNHKLSITP